MATLLILKRSVSRAAYAYEATREAARWRARSAPLT